MKPILNRHTTRTKTIKGLYVLEVFKEGSTPTGYRLACPSCGKESLILAETLNTDTPACCDRKPQDARIPLKAIQAHAAFLQRALGPFPDPWKELAAFIEANGVPPDHRKTYLVRINPNKQYSKHNCRWGSGREYLLEKKMYILDENTNTKFETRIDRVDDHFLAQVWKVTIEDGEKHQTCVDKLAFNLEGKDYRKVYQAAYRWATKSAKARSHNQAYIN